MNLPFAAPEKERDEKMKSLCSDAGYSKKSFFEALEGWSGDKKNVLEALRYAESLDFSKTPLKGNYLSHPIRVATSV